MLEPERDFTFGRGREETTPPRLEFERRRPNSIERTGPIEEEQISRRQAIFRWHAPEGITLDVMGQSPTTVNGTPVTPNMPLKVGDLIGFKEQMLLMLVRAPLMPSLDRFPRARSGKFGEPNAFDFVGESPVFWAMIAARRIEAAPREFHYDRRDEPRARAAQARFSQPLSCGGRASVDEARRLFVRR